jgi:hypothetical protein
VAELEPAERLTFTEARNDSVAIKIDIWLQKMSMANT